MPAPARARNTPATAKPSPAEAAAAEATPETQDDTIQVPFRGVQIPVPNPAKTTESFAVQMALAAGSNAKLLYALVGEQGTRMIQATLKPDDAFLDVVEEFFKAYGEVTGQGNS